MSLLSRLEALEQKTPGLRWPEHWARCTVAHDEDADAKQAAALAEYRAAHGLSPDDEVALSTVYLIEAIDGRPAHPEFVAEVERRKAANRRLLTGQHA